MRLIDTDVLKEWVENWLYKDRYYHNGRVGKTIPITELYDLLEQIPTADVPDRKVGEWDMFDLISSAYYGKGMYFKQDNDIVYSRYSCKHMTVDEAIREFVSLIDDSDLPPVQPEQRWIPVTERLPEDEQEVLVTRHFLSDNQLKKNAITESYYVEVASLTDDEWTSYSDEYKIKRHLHKVIAWMPLPKPWKGESDEHTD